MLTLKVKQTATATPQKKNLLQLIACVQTAFDTQNNVVTNAD